MQLLKRCFSFYIYGNIHVALAAYCLTKITLLQFDIHNQSLANFIFFSTVLAYNCIRFFQLKNINSMTSIWILANKKGLIILNILAFMGVFYFGVDFKGKDLWVLLPLILTTIFYVIPLTEKIKGLRHIPGLKLILISFTWAGITMYLPVYMAGLNETPQLWLYFLKRFLFVMAITIPFDIRDASFDLPELSTLPQLLGVPISKIIALAAILMVLGVDWQLDTLDAAYFGIDLFIVILSLLMIAFTTENRGRYYTAFWIESLPIFWYVLYLVPNYV